MNFLNSNLIPIRLAVAFLALGRLLAARENTAGQGEGAIEGRLGVQEFVLSAPASGGELVLNEVVSSNQDSLRDEDGDSPDWIELFNGGNAPVSLAGWGLSDDLNRPFRWVFPVTTLGPRSYLVVFASGKDRRTPGSPLHTDFQLQASGEPVLLTRPDGTRQDIAVGVRLREDVSWGRFPNGTGAWKYFAIPTPRRSNSVQTAYESIVFAAPTVTPDSGFYAESVAATLSLAEGDTVLRYTLDGTEPDESSLVYTAPLEVRSRAGEPNVLSLIRGTSTANQHTDGWKAPSGEVRKATVLRTRATRAGAIPGPVVTRTYFVGADAARVDGLPTLALTTDPDGLFDYDRGIYMLGAIFDRYVAAHPGEVLTGHTPANYTQRGGEWECPAQLEWFEPDGRRAFGEPVMVDIQGQSSRSFRQKSFGVKAENSFVHAVFPGLTRLGDGTPLQEFRNLRLRNMGNDWDYALMRDDWCHRLASGLGLNLMASRYVSLYLDGEYWGILAAREQQNTRYVQAHYGVNPSEVVILHAAGTLEEGLPGDETPWMELLKFCQTHDLSVPSNYEYVAARLDPQDALLYYLSEIYFANADWPQNNMRVWRRRMDVPDASLGRGLDGRWRWFLFDVDLGVAHPWSAGVNDNTLSAALSPTGRPGFDSTWGTAVIRALMTHPEWKREFITTAADLLNSWYSPNRATALVETMRGELRPAMDEHIRRWRSNGGNVAAWETHVRGVRDFAAQRAARMRAHLLGQFQLGGQSRITLDVNDAVRGRVRINRLLVDASLPGVNAAPYPWTGVYFNTVPVTLEAVAAPGWQFDGWTGLAATGPIASWTPGGNMQVTARFVALPAVIREAAIQGNSVRLRITGTPGASYAIQGADDLLYWSDVGSCTCGADGQAEVQVPMVIGGSRRFLRALAR